MGRRKSPNGQLSVTPAGAETQPVPDRDAGGALAPAHPAATWPTARQSLNRHGHALRRAFCPTHERIARRFVGSTADGWAFSCVNGPHTFTVLPDPTAPKSAYEAAAAAAYARANPRR
mgnify:CR=1 FL=1